MRRSLIVATIYALLAAVMTWPILGRLGWEIPGSDGDAWVHLWTWRWLRDALAGGQDIWFADGVFHPVGVSLVSHNIAWLNFAAWWPLQLVIDDAAAYSLVFVGILVFNGLTVYWLARIEIGADGPAFLAGLIAAFWPYTLSNHHHPNLILTGFVALTMIALHRTLTRGRWRDTALLALSIALLGLGRWQMLIIGGILIGLYLVRLLVAEPEFRTRKPLTMLLAAGLGAVLLVMPLLAPVLSTQLSTDELEVLLNVSTGNSADLLAYFVPNRYHPLWGEWAFQQFHQNFTTSQYFVPFLGYMTLILAGAAVVLRWRAVRFWVLAATIYWLLALGSELTFNDADFFPLPYSLLDSFLPFRFIRHPDRFNVILSIPFAILAGHGVAALQERLGWSGRRAQALLTIAAILILSEYAVTYRMIPLAVPVWYQQLAEEAGDFAVVNLPMHNRRYSEQYLQYQSVHGKPMVGGKIARIPDAAFAFIDQVPMLKRYDVTYEVPDEGPSAVAQMEQLAQANVRYLVLNKKYLPPDKLADWQSWLGTTPDYEDNELAVYRTTP